MQSFQCISCEHYQGVKTCTAFPDEIPDEIYTGDFDHRKPYAGDRGIRWKPLRDDVTIDEGEE